MTQDWDQFKRDLLLQAHLQGFELAGIAPATPAETRAAYLEWLSEGCEGEMAYLARNPPRRYDPKIAWPETASILVLGLNYRSEVPAPEEAEDPRRGRIAQYALGDDYHEVIGEKLKALLEWAKNAGGPGLEGRRYVDTGPLLERDLAARAGLGWFGKNTCLINRAQGSYFFLAALLLNVELPLDAPTSAHCGTCTRCLSACPTGAFLGPHVLDARRCIAYLTIELRGPIPRELRPLVGNWIFGCDVCQEVCPWNRKAPTATEERFAARPVLHTPELISLLRLTQEEFSAMFRRSAVKRAKRRGFLRNVCVALGNSGDLLAVPALTEALQHEEPLVRGHAAWALGRLCGLDALEALRLARRDEADPWVREEITAALDEAEAPLSFPVSLPLVPGPHSPLTMPSELYDTFLKHVCQTSDAPLGLEIESALGATLRTRDGRTFIDFLAGIAVNNVGHAHPAVVEAIREQAGKYLHAMVYGEYVLEPQVLLAQLLAQSAPDPLSVVYFTNSGTEANEGALKLAKKYTGRRKLLAFRNSYHGDSQGSLSVTGRDVYRNPFLPLLPEVEFLSFGETEELERIDETVAGVITEPIQGEGGVRVPPPEWLPTLRRRCTETGALLIFDEVQTGFGRTGKLFAGEHWGVVPDILVLAKALGGGMPLGAFVGAPEVMASLSHDPPLAHVTTFGGHPVCCAAGLASLRVILEEDLPARAERTGTFIRQELRTLGERFGGVRDVRGLGMLIGLELDSAARTRAFAEAAFVEGVILGWTLHSDTVIRMAPPLNISDEELELGLAGLSTALAAAGNL